MSTAMFARELLLVVNEVWLDMALARLLGQVPETVDPYMDVLELAAGRPFIEREVSTVYAQLLVSQQREDGSWEIEPRCWACRRLRPPAVAGAGDSACGDRGGPARSAAEAV